MVSEHPVFRRRGQDILVDHTIGLGEALLGANVVVPTLQGDKRIKVPPGSADGTSLRLKGMGVAASGQKEAGSLLVIIHVRIPRPEELEPAELAVIEQLKARGI
jgi:curved DNA-binding protein